MTIEAADSEAAERLTRRRARLLPVLAVLYLGQQASFFSTRAPGAGHVGGELKLSAWLLLSALLLLLIATGGGWFRSKEVRRLIDDENTRANRLDAMRLGFVVAMVAGMALYVAEMLTDVTTGEAIHLIVSAGIGAALIRFGMLERRALRDG